MQPVAILASGMVTGVGLNAPASCAAIRCAIDNFSETRFMDKGGEWIIGSQVPLEQPWRGLLQARSHGRARHPRMPRAEHGTRPSRFRCSSASRKKQRPGRLEGLDDQLFQEIDRRSLGMRFHPRSGIIARGRVAGALALIEARRLIYNERVPLLHHRRRGQLARRRHARRLREKNRLLTSQNSNGFIPGEAGAPSWLGHQSTRAGQQQKSCSASASAPVRKKPRWIPNCHCEQTVSCKPSKRRSPMPDTTIEDVDYRLTDANGEQYWFKEAGLAVTRTLRVTKEDFEIWHPVDCIGEIGAAIGPCALGVALAAARKNYAPGPGSSVSLRRR